TLYSSLFVLVSMSMFISYPCLRVLPSLCLVISVLSRLLIFSLHLRLHLRVRLHPAFVFFFFFSQEKGGFLHPPQFPMMEAYILVGYTYLMYLTTIIMHLNKKFQKKCCCSFFHKLQLVFRIYYVMRL